jgi:hypothetical protein
MYFANPNLRRFEMAESNRRHFPRQNAEGTIQVLLIPDDFEGRKDSRDSIPAKMVNQSDNGLYIEIDRDLQPGSNVRIKMVFQEESCYDEAYYIRDGRVIWREKVDNGTTRFGVGIKILRKAIQAYILTSRFK